MQKEKKKPSEALQSGTINWKQERIYTEVFSWYIYFQVGKITEPQPACSLS
jgi:hypothetical protein